MSVLITGGLGHVGSWVAYELARMGKKVIICDAAAAQFDRLAPDYLRAVHQLGGFRVQGKSDDAAERMIDEAKQLEQAGASSLVIECIPAPLGKRVTEALTILTIGIGAGPDCSGQILILHDMLDITRAREELGFEPEFTDIRAGVRDYGEWLRNGSGHH